MFFYGTDSRDCVTEGLILKKKKKKNTQELFQLALHYYIFLMSVLHFERQSDNEKLRREVLHFWREKLCVHV